MPNMLDSPAAAQRVIAAADARAGEMKYCVVTLSATPDTETTITLADWVIGFRLFPRSADIRFGVGESASVVLATSSATTLTVGDNFGVGGIAKAGQWEVRRIKSVDSGSRTLKLRSGTASVVVDVEVF